MNNFTFSFENLEVWQLARQYVGVVYKHRKAFPAEERYALCDQIRRAAVSVASNIAEGSGRSSYKDKAHYVEISYGSLMETYCQFTLALDLGYISQIDFEEIKSRTITISRKLTALKKSFESKL